MKAKSKTVSKVKSEGKSKAKSKKKSKLKAKVSGGNEKKKKKKNTKQASAVEVDADVKQRSKSSKSMLDTNKMAKGRKQRNAKTMSKMLSKGVGKKVVAASKKGPPSEKVGKREEEKECYWRQ